MAQQSELQDAETIHVIVTGFGPFDKVTSNPTERLVTWLQQQTDPAPAPDASLSPATATPLRRLRHARIASCTVLTVSARAVTEYLMQQLEELLRRGEATRAARAAAGGGGHVRGAPVVLLLHFGVDVKRPTFNLESRAVNNATFRCPDADGWQPNNRPITSLVAAPPAGTGDAPAAAAPPAPGGGGGDGAGDGDGAAACGLDGAVVSDLDLPRLCERLRGQGHNVLLSEDAGRFVCNWTYYNSLSLCQALSGRTPALAAAAAGAAAGGAVGAAAGGGGRTAAAAGTGAGAGAGVAAHSLFVHVPKFEEIPEEGQRRFAIDLTEALCEQLHEEYFGSGRSREGGGGGGGAGVGGGSSPSVEGGPVLAAV